MNIPTLETKRLKLRAFTLALSPRFWGHGYATEAAQASVNWAFEQAGLRRLISLIDPENKASEAVALRLGEQFRERITFNGKPANVFEIGAR